MSIIPLFMTYHARNPVFNGNSESFVHEVSLLLPKIRDLIHPSHWQECVKAIISNVIQHSCWVLCSILNSSNYAETQKNTKQNKTSKSWSRLCWWFAVHTSLKIGGSHSTQRVYGEFPCHDFNSNRCIFPLFDPGEIKSHKSWNGCYFITEY